MIVGENLYTSLDDSLEEAILSRCEIAYECAVQINKMAKLALAAMHAPINQPRTCGWYREKETGTRVIAIDYYHIMVAVPEDFEIKDLPEIPEVKKQ